MNFQMSNGRCRMHGGKSVGRPMAHGFYTQQAVAERKHLSELIKEIQQLSGSVGDD